MTHFICSFVVTINSNSVVTELQSQVTESQRRSKHNDCIHAHAIPLCATDLTFAPTSAFLVEQSKLGTQPFFNHFFVKRLSDTGPPACLRLACTPPRHPLCSSSSVWPSAARGSPARKWPLHVIRLRSQVMDFTLSYPTLYPNCTQEAMGCECVCVCVCTYKHASVCVCMCVWHHG